jgi:autotransporter-associated beta strand protein
LPKSPTPAGITGSKVGIEAFAGSVVVTNSGSITSTLDYSIFANTNATVTNSAGGSITGAIGINADNGSAVITNSGSITGSSQYGIFAFASATVTNNAGASITGAGYGIVAGAGNGIVNGGGSSVFNAGTISGGIAAIAFNGSGNTLTLASGSVISGDVLGTGSDVFQLGGTGAATFDVSQIGAAAQYQGFGTLNKIDSSVWTLTGTGSYAGPVNVNGGTLAVNGDISSASSLTVNAGGTLGGNGIVGNTTINGGTLAPGNSIGTLTVSGSLTMTAASTYMVQVSGASADKTIVTGAANIAGKVTVDMLTRLSATTTYTILTGGTMSGTFSAAEFLAANNFARNARLSYVGNSVLLTLDPGLLSPNLSGNANFNQKNTAAGIDNALVGGATLPAGFNALFALSGDALLKALTQASGETATGSQQTTFDAMNLFMGVLTDPFTAGRGGAAPGATGFADEDSANAYAASGRKRSGAERDAYGMFTKAPPAPPFEARWNVWAAGFGGSQTTDGNATLGSNTATSRIGGVAVGADYWFSPQTIAGFALAGGGTNFSVAGGGSGRSDLFQAGAFVRHNVGSAYLTAAAAYGWQDITTDRTVTIAGIDQLRAQFNANAFSGRVEGGNRYVLPWIGGIGVTPYAAAQVIAFDLPAYAESVLSGASTFALAYAAKTVTATRSELGLRSDKSYAVGDAILTLRGRAAWAHDFNAERGIAATFQTLPGASFVVNGAAPAHDAALTTASAEMKFISGLSLAATFEGEFSDVTRSYAGKGVVRYAW